jgi:hypothetical protein
VKHGLSSDQHQRHTSACSMMTQLCKRTKSWHLSGQRCYRTLASMCKHASTSVSRLPCPIEIAHEIFVMLRYCPHILDVPFEKFTSCLLPPLYWAYTICLRESHELSPVVTSLGWRSHSEFALDEAHQLLVAHEVPDAAHDHGQHGPAALLCMVVDILLPILVPLRRRWLRRAQRLIPSRLPGALQCTSKAHQAL